MAEAISVTKPENGWFIPNCDKMPGFLNDKFANERRSVKVPQFDGEKDVNVLQVRQTDLFDYLFMIHSMMN